jgi:ABC-type multidrug transport system ATPase subunit/ABC-type multidrug transport system permease subunit
VAHSIISYVTQEDDALLPALTVRETLRFAATLRLPKHMSHEEKIRRAEDVLLKMGLKDCANTPIGNDLVKGISGGEKRRVTIGIQLLTDPRILLLDEPTSGLDAFTAQSIVQLLQNLAEEGRTVCLTIHQSRSDIWPSFHNVLLLARGGHQIYSGSGEGMMSHFESLGFPCPEHANPADFALDLITVDLRHARREIASRERVQKLVDEWARIRQNRPASSLAKISSAAELGSLQKSMANLTTAFPILIRRSMINFLREKNAAIARIMQVVGYAIVLALFFSPLKRDYNAIQTRLGYVGSLTAIYFVGMLQNVAVYPAEKLVFYSEHNDRAYSVEAFFLQYTALEIPFEIFTAILFAILADLAVGMPRTAEVFFAICYCCFCIVNCGESLGIVFNTLFDHTGFAVNITSVILSLGQIMAGVMSIDMPAFLRAFNYLSPLKYATIVLAHYAFDGIQFTCSESQKLPNGQCPQQTGDQVLKLYKLDKNLHLNLMALGVTTIVYRLLSYLLLKSVRERLFAITWRR